MGLTFKVSMQFCSLQHLTLLPSPVTSTTCIVFVWLSLFIVSGAISRLFSSSILVTCQPGEFHLSMSYLFTFLYCSWGSQGKNTEVFCHSLLQWITFCQYSSAWRLHGMAHSFTELDKAVIHVIFWVSFLWLWYPTSKSKGEAPTRWLNHI